MPTTKYIWNPINDSYLMETDGDGNTQAVYTNEPTLYGNLISQRRDNITSYYHYDAIGSTRELTNSSETVTDTNMYDAWGVNQQSSGNTNTPFRYIGAFGYAACQFTGSCYARTRYYAMSLARWVSQDPLMFAADNNLYRYALNDPVKKVDPNGLGTGTAAYLCKDRGGLILGKCWCTNPRFFSFLLHLAMKDIIHCCCLRGLIKSRKPVPGFGRKPATWFISDCLQSTLNLPGDKIPVPVGVFRCDCN